VNRFAASRSVFAAILVLFAVDTATWAENWPQWRGPTNDGISRETNLPIEWNDTRNIIWKLPLPGMGGSTPAVWGDRIFVTSSAGSEIVLFCISTEGKELWRAKLGTGDKTYQRGPEANHASPSPSTDGKHVWAMAGTGDLACFDFEGKEVWRCNLQERYGTFKQNWGGMHMSPLLDGDRLYLALLHANGAWVLALDKATGKEVWKVKRESDAMGESKESYASPIIWRHSQEACLITHGGDYTIGHRLSDGAEIWRVGDLNPKQNYSRAYRFVTSPVVSGDLVVIPTAKRGVVVGARADAQGLVGPGSKYELWRKRSGTPDVPSPLVHDGLVYLCGEMGVLTCLDAKTGEQLYEERVHNFIHRASPVYADGKIYLTSRDGLVTVVKAGPKFEVLATNKLSDQISGSPAISNGRIYLHGWKALYAIGSGKS
jgi:outer membrane protein assembly factor BamB